MKTGEAQTISHERKHGERGSVLVITALGMFALLFSAVLAIDLKRLDSTRAELQNAADASALAAASQLNATSSGIRSAVSQATNALNNYDFKHKVTIATSEVTFGAQLNGEYVDMTTAMANPGSVRFARVTFSPPADKNLLALVIPRANNISATASADFSVGLMMNKSTNEGNRANTSRSF